jgi:hypothetical protein
MKQNKYKFRLRISDLFVYAVVQTGISILQPKYNSLDEQAESNISHYYYKFGLNVL